MILREGTAYLFEAFRFELSFLSGFVHKNVNMYRILYHDMTVGNYVNYLQCSIDAKCLFITRIKFSDKKS